MSDRALLYAGEKTGLRDLNDVLCEQHEQRRAAVNRTIEKHRASGAPPADEVDYARVRELVGDMARLSRDAVIDTIALRPLAEAVLVATATGLAPWPEYERNPRLEGVRVSCVVLDARTWRTIAGEDDRLEKESRTAPSGEARERATDALFDARREVLKKALDRVEIGAEVLDVFDDRVLDALERVSLITFLFLAVVAAQDLSPGKASRSGSQPA